jgi:hypothetical protein
MSLACNVPTGFDRARAVADAVLFEGYALYPYRPTSPKNQLRWQFGVLAPRAASEATRSDPWWLELQCLVTGGAATRVDGKLRFLRLRKRRVATPAGEPIASLEVAGKLLVPWDEGEVCELDFAHPLSSSETTMSFTLDGAESEESICEAGAHAGGAELARVRRTQAPLSITLAIASEATGVDGVRKLRLRVENSSACAEPAAPRDQMLAGALLGTHLLLAVDGGEFISLLDPPLALASAAASCRNVGTYPVLAGEPGRRDLLLSSPIILYDHPAVAPESPGNLFDATEIDEILSLRTLLLTDEEKRLARATDAHVAAIIDRVDALPTEAWSRLHGAFRDRADSARVRIGDAAVAAGSRVRLRPGPRRSDAQDMFLDGRTATVQEVKRDLDGRACLAVTVDDDPAADLHAWHGRYHYFYADEVEPLS